MKLYRYYSLSRPIGINTYPRHIQPKNIYNFKHRRMINQMLAYGYLETIDPLSDQECFVYDLYQNNEQFRKLNQA